MENLLGLLQHFLLAINTVIQPTAAVKHGGRKKLQIKVNNI